MRTRGICRSRTATGNAAGALATWEFRGILGTPPGGGTGPSVGGLGQWAAFVEAVGGVEGAGKVESASIVASVVSIILGLVAISISIFFYTQAKDSEKEVSRALEGIRVQTESLQKLTGKHMDKLIKGATDRKTDEESLMRLVDVVAGFPDTMSTLMQLPTQALPEAGTEEDPVQKRRMNELYITLFAYSNWLNLALQGGRWSLLELEVTENVFKSFLDVSHRDFSLLLEILGDIDSTELSQCLNYQSYLDILKVCHLVKTSEELDV